MIQINFMSCFVKREGLESSVSYLKSKRGSLVCSESQRGWVTLFVLDIFHKSSPLSYLPNNKLWILLKNGRGKKLFTPNNIFKTFCQKSNNCGMNDSGFIFWKWTCESIHISVHATNIHRLALPFVCRGCDWSICYPIALCHVTRLRRDSLQAKTSTQAWDRLQLTKK